MALPSNLNVIRLQRLTLLIGMNARKKGKPRKLIMRYAEDQIHAYLHPYGLRLIIIE